MRLVERSGSDGGVQGSWAPSWMYSPGPLFLAPVCLPHQEMGFYSRIKESLSHSTVL